MKQTYQLTKHPVGTISEIWTLAWPLMMGLMSTCLMIFVDRLLLAWYAPAALNAAANAGMAYYLLLVIPLSICAISEVLTGRLHGSKEPKEIGAAVWQMVWLAVLTLPLFWLAAICLPPFLFYGTGNEVAETAYFQPLMMAAPFACVTVALSGFFIGIGKVRFVTYCTLAANAVNFVGAYLLIFGYGPIPDLGVYGASLAMCAAEVFQTFCLLFFFLKRRYREAFGTAKWRYHAAYFWEGLQIGFPAGMGHGIEVLAHYAFFRIVMLGGQEQLTIVAMVQSFYILAAFFIEAQSKSVSAIVANLIGAGKENLIGKVILAATKLHTLSALLLLGVIIAFPNSLLSLFLAEHSAVVLDNPAFMLMAYHAALWMSLFYLCDGLSWILIGQLTAAGDTKFIFYISALVNWITYVLPAFLLIGLSKGGADIAWMVIAMYSVINCAIYFWRYQSGRWQTPLLLKSKG